MSFTISVKNSGSNPAVGVAVTDVLAACLTFISASGSGWTIPTPVGKQLLQP